MKLQEDYPYCLDCFYDSDPSDRNKPDKQEGAESREIGEDRGNKLWAARSKNRFKRIILYRDSGDVWEEVQCWPSS